MRWRSPNRRRPAQALAVNGPQQSDALGGAISPRDIIADLKRQPGCLVDRFGHPRHERVLDNWSVEACLVMGLHRVDDGGDP